MEVKKYETFRIKSKQTYGTNNLQKRTNAPRTPIEHQNIQKNQTNETIHKEKNNMTETKKELLESIRNDYELELIYEFEEIGEDN